MVLALLVLVASSGAALQQAPPSKRQYNLFHRTPADLRRPLATDRPDRTESPYTVDAGLFQLEADLFTYSGDGSAGGDPAVDGTSYAFLPFNLKAGLLPNVDLQVVLETWAWKRELGDGASRRERGLGAITIRTKVNLWGNDGGRTAFAIMPFVAFVASPGAADRVFNGGLVMPLSVELGAGWRLGSMLQLDVARAGPGAPRKVGIVGSASIGRTIAGPLGFYVEGYGGTILADDEAAWEATGDLGLTLGIGPNLQLDAGLNLGFTRIAEDVNPFVGLAVRF